MGNGAVLADVKGAESILSASATTALSVFCFRKLNQNPKFCILPPSIPTFLPATR
jgi:hypothetical protein